MRNETSISIDAPLERVWSVMTDVERWPEWTESMSKVERLDGGDFGTGSRARIKQPKVPAAVWQVSAFEPGRSFEWENKSPGLHSVGGHRVESDGDASKVTLWVEQNGVAEPLFRLLFSGMTRRYIQMEAEGLKRRCESDAS